MSSTTNPVNYRIIAEKMAYQGTDKKTAKKVNKMAREKLDVDRDVFKKTTDQFGNTKYMAIREAGYYQIAVYILMVLLPALLVLFFGVLIGFENDDSSGGGSTNRCEGITSTATGGTPITDRTGLVAAATAWIADPVAAKATYGGDINTWDVSSVDNMSFIFSNSYGATNGETFNSDIGCWDTSGTETMQAMFFNNTQFNQDISKWDVSNVDDFRWMFQNNTVFNNNEGEKQTFRNWKVNTDPSANTENMFLDATAMTTKYTGTDGYGNTPTPATFFNQNFS